MKEPAISPAIVEARFDPRQASLYGPEHEEELLKQARIRHIQSTPKKKSEKSSN